MRKTVLLAAIAAVLIGGGVLATAFGSRGAGTSTCPGKIVCPLSGKEVCRDRCPLQRESSEDTAVPSCCRRAG